MKNILILGVCLTLSLACSPKSAPKADQQEATKKTASTPAKAAATPAKEASKPAATKANNKRVFFVEPKAGAQVSSPVKVVFGLEGMTISPAGQNLGDKTKGHHHLIIDGKSIPAGQIVPMNATHKHFGKGQTETTLTLAPGKHTLTMQFADAMHMSYGPDMSATIEVDVK